MKVYFDEDKGNVVIEGLSRFFNSNSLEAIQVGSKVGIRYVGTDIYQVFNEHSNYKDKDGNPTGATASDTAQYMNNEFAKGEEVEGDSSFTNVSPTVAVTDNRLSDGDIIYIVPTVNVINEIYFPTIVQNNSFTVNRIVINAVNGLTVNLPFRWKKLRR
jgi:molybdopterin converting factor small subunit